MRLILAASFACLVSACGSSAGDKLSNTFFERAEKGAGEQELCDLASRTASAFLEEGNTKKYEDFMKRKEAICTVSQRNDRIIDNLDRSIGSLNN